MAKYSHEQIPVCKSCHQKIHLEKYDGTKLQVSKYNSVNNNCRSIWGDLCLE